MTCDDTRAALSARMDGEPAGGVAAVDAHLADCPACRAWLARAEQVTRVVRLQAANVPDLTDRIMAAATAEGHLRPAGRAVAEGHLRPADDRERRARRQVLRLAVALAAVVQLTLAVPVLVLGGLGIVDYPHAGREMASFDVAMAVGFALAAWRPQRARAFVPIAFVLATCLAATTVIDVANATTALAHEVGHLAAVVQAALLWALGRLSPADESFEAGPMVGRVAPAGPAASA